MWCKFNFSENLRFRQEITPKLVFHVSIAILKMYFYLSLVRNTKHPTIYKLVYKISIIYFEFDREFDFNSDKKTFVRPTVMLIYHQHSTSTNSFDRKSINSSSIDKKSL